MVRLATPTDLETIKAETGRDFSGPCTLVVYRGDLRAGLLAVRDRSDCIEVSRIEADTPQIALRLVEMFERILAVAGIDRYRFTAELGRMEAIASKMVDRGVFCELGSQGPYKFYERIIKNATRT